MREYVTNSPEETEQLACGLAPVLRNCTGLIALYGGLGAGKTGFVRGLAAGLGLDPEAVSSPTFALVNEYPGTPTALIHFDLYRISGWGDLESTGFFDYLERPGALLAVEWSEHLGEALLPDVVRITLTPLSENSRRICVEGGRRLEDAFD